MAAAVAVDSCRAVALERNADSCRCRIEWVVMVSRHAGPDGLASFKNFNQGVATATPPAASIIHPLGGASCTFKKMRARIVAGSDWRDR